MAATVYEQKKWFGRLQFMHGFYFILALGIVGSISIITLISDLSFEAEGDPTRWSSWGKFTMFSLGFLSVFLFINLFCFYIAKKGLIANLSKLFRQLSEGSEELFVIFANGKHSLFSKSQFVNELSQMLINGTLRPLVCAGMEDYVNTEDIKSIEVYDFRKAEHRACLEIYLEQLRGHIKCLEAKPAEIAQRIAEVRAEETRCSRFLVGQPA